MPPAYPAAFTPLRLNRPRISGTLAAALATPNTAVHRGRQPVRQITIEGSSTATAAVPADSDQAAKLFTSNAKATVSGSNCPAPRHTTALSGSPPQTNTANPRTHNATVPVASGPSTPSTDRNLDHNPEMKTTSRGTAMLVSAAPA